MIPTNGSSFGRAGGRLRRYPGGTENASIFATVRGSIPNRRAASRRLSPSTYTARRTCPYSSTPFIPPPSAHLGRRFTAAGLSLRRVLYPAASVMDFLSGALTKMVELFDARGISFVAVTQQFNTTTSMGRLTLNVLLSFAQFEREVTGERIRDKI